LAPGNIKAGVNIKQQVKIDKIEVIDKTQKKSVIENKAVLLADIDKSVYSYVDKCYCRINNKILNSFPFFALGNEVKIFVTTSKNSSPEELFYGVVRKRQKKWDKPKDLDFTEFWATSFAQDASTKILYAWQMEYTNGYGEVLTKLAELINLETNCVPDKSIKGSLYFDHISVLDAMRLLAYLKGWCLRFKGKTVKLAKCESPQHSGVTINLQDLPKGTITEG
jgi:hypothetical protein